MQKWLTICILLASLSQAMAQKARKIDSAFVAKLGLPILSIHTIDKEKPTCDFVFAPEGEFGISTTNKTKVPGRVILSMADSIIFDSGVYEKNNSGMTIRIRGNTSAYYSRKKPYKIKLEKKGDMLGREDDRFNDKNWLLIDESGDNLNAMIGLKLNDIMKLGKWTPAYKVVNLMFNDEYHGIYMLIESVKRNADCRINISKSGFLFERDAYWWNEDVYFETPMGMKYTFKYPDEEDIDASQMDYISEVMTAVEQSISEGNYDEYIDVRSFALWLLAEDILGMGDAAGTNIYLTKNDSTPASKVKMSTLWDFNACFRNTATWASIHQHPFFYFQRLLNSNNRTFAAAYKYLWEQMSDDIFTQLSDFVNQLSESELAEAIQTSREYDGMTWRYTPDSISDNISKATQWLQTRKQWLNENIDTLMAPAYTDAIKEKTVRCGSPDIIYNLSGQRVNPSVSQPGIYIKDGRKILIR